MRFLRRSKRKGKITYPTEEDMIAWVGSLAHEIKNPLNTMRLNLQLLHEDWEQSNESDKEKNLKRLGTLSKEVDRLEKILNDFMGLARLPHPNMKTYNILSLLEEFFDFIEPEAQQSNIQVIREFDSDLPEVALDADQIKQALLNITQNAYQSMSSGGQLRVKAYRTNDHLAIDITDTGHGIPDERIHKLFDLFYSTKRRGTGLGLSIAKRIVDMHNGEIHVKSEEGKGSTFSITLPIHQNMDSTS
jgi:signal transduction histidine kinase